jgi:hypothetical protein
VRQKRSVKREREKEEDSLAMPPKARRGTAANHRATDAASVVPPEGTHEEGEGRESKEDVWSLLMWTERKRGE